MRAKILRWIAILTLGWIAILFYAVYLGHQYINDIDDIAKSLAIGGSPFLIQLPKDSSVQINITGKEDCGRIVIFRSGEAYFSTGNQPVQISLNNGLLDLTPYIQSFKECDAVSIKTMGLFLDECLFDVKYTDAKIIDIGTPECTY